MNEAERNDALAVLAELRADMARAAAEREQAAARYEKLHNHSLVQAYYLEMVRQLFNAALGREKVAIAALEDAGDDETAATLRAARSASIDRATAEISPDPKRLN